MEVGVDDTEEAVVADQHAFSNHPIFQAWQRVATGDPETIRDAQTYLADKGYNTGPADGHFGPQTAKALEAHLMGVHPNVHNSRVRAVESKHPVTGKFQKGGVNG